MVTLQDHDSAENLRLMRKRSIFANHPLPNSLSTDITSKKHDYGRAMADDNRDGTLYNTATQCGHWQFPVLTHIQGNRAINSMTMCRLSQAVEGVHGAPIRRGDRVVGTRRTIA